MSQIKFNPPKNADPPSLDPESAAFYPQAIPILEQYLSPNASIGLEEGIKRMLELLTYPDTELMRERVNGLTDETMYRMGGDKPVPSQETIRRLTGVDGAHFALAELLMENVPTIPYNDPAHIKLARLLVHLTPRANDPGQTWAPLYPLRGPVLRSIQPHWEMVHFRNSLDEFRNPYMHYCDNPPYSEAVVEDGLSAHVNFHAFAAYLGQFRLLNMTQVALSELRECFEEDWDNPRLHSSLGYIKTVLEAVADESRTKVRSALTTASAMWIFINGQNLFTEIGQCPKEFTQDLEERQMQVGARFKGPIFGLQRWTFWREGFETAARGEGVDDKCASLAAKAANVMQVFEDSMWH